MCAESKENVGDDQPRLLRHLTKWKPLYQSAGVASVVVAIIFGGISLRQTQKAMTIAVSSLNLSRGSVELQKEEFMLRNRPLVVIGNHEFSGPAGDSTGRAFPRSFKIHAVNIMDIPATQVQGTVEVRLNGEIIGTPRLPPTAVAKGTTRTLALGLTEETYSAAINPSNRFEATTYLTYSGMLGEQSDHYMTRVTVYWSISDGHFISTEECYK